MTNEIEAKILMGKLSGKNPNCFFCRHGNIIRGSAGNWHEPPEPDEVECTMVDDKLDALFEKVEYDEEQMPSLCGHFDPYIVSHCKHCGKEMNEPIYLCEFSTFEVHGNDEVNLCSLKCKNEFHTEQNQIYLKEKYHAITRMFNINNIN